MDRVKKFSVLELNRKLEPNKPEFGSGSPCRPGVRSCRGGDKCLKSEYLLGSLGSDMNYHEETIIRIIIKVS